MAPTGTETLPEESHSPSGAPSDAGPSPAPPRITRLGMFASGMALLLPLAYSPALASRVWGPKAALAILLAGVGLPLILRDRTIAAKSAGVFLLIATASTLLSENPVMSVLGSWGQGSGLVFVASLVGAWCIGRRLTAADGKALHKALLVAIALNAGIALLQMMVNLTAFDLQLVFGRSTGLLGNPVYLGGLLGGGFLLAAYARPSPWQFGQLVLFAAAGACSQGRVTLLLAAVCPLLVIRRWGVRSAVVAALALGVGWFAGTALTLGSPVTGSPGERSDEAVASVATDTYTAREGLGPRLETWRIARQPITDRPLLGSGPGRFWAATVPHRTLELAKHSPLQYYTDPHNFVVEYATTTGILGLLSLMAWLGFATWRAAGPLALFAVGLAVHHLFQPQSVALTPIALLALGAAAPVATNPLARWERSTVTLGASIALIAAGLFLFGQYSLQQAYLDLDARHADRSLALLPWPETAQRRYIVAANKALSQRKPDWSEARSYLLEAVSRDRQDPRPWGVLGDFELARGRFTAAERAYRRVVALDPWNVDGNQGLANVGRSRQDREMVDYWEARLTRVGGGD